ncbi:MAG TPA: DUF885 domain-containing protein [Caulobacteraceae bacterium]
MSAIAAFADGLLYEMMAASPDLAAELGLTEVDGRALPTDTLVDVSDAAAAARRGLMARRAGALGEFDEEALTGDDRLTFQTLCYLLEDGFFGPFCGRAGHRFQADPYPLNHLLGFHPALTMMLSRDHVVRSADDAEAYLARLAKAPAALDGAIEAARRRQDEGYATPHVSLQLALADMRRFLAAPDADNLLVAALRSKLAAVEDGRLAGFAARAEQLFGREVRPAYERLVDETARLATASPDDDGVWRLPDGEAYYAWVLGGHLTAGLTPDEVHQIGLDETERLQSAIRAEFASLGVAGQSIPELYKAIEGPRPFGGSGDRERALAETTALVHGLAERAAPMFGAFPRAPIEVDLIPAAFEDSLNTCYTPPMAGGGRPGRFSLNLRDALESPAWELARVCAHEAAPGHHVQLALAQEASLGAFRRTVVFTAYIEGWAKYAETLIDHDLMDDPYVRLGRLRGELYSSVNLALDTGVHARRWSREKACAFFVDNTGVTPAFARSIVDRGLVSPGQLCAYKIGMLKMLELRSRCRAARGGDYRVQDFHDSMLRHGALPLSVLEAVVEADLAAASADGAAR